MALFITLFKDKTLHKDIFKRRKVIEKLKAEIIKKIKDLKLEFLACEEDLVNLLLNYIRQHKSYFEY